MNGQLSQFPADPHPVGGTSKFTRFSVSGDTNGELVEALARCAREAGREIATLAEARGGWG